MELMDCQPVITTCWRRMQGSVKNYWRTDVSWKGGTFPLIYNAALLFVATSIIPTWTTWYGTTPTIPFRGWVSVTTRHASHSIYSRASTRVAPRLSPTWLTLGLVQGVFIELLSSEGKGGATKTREAIKRGAWCNTFSLSMTRFFFQNSTLQL